MWGFVKYWSMHKTWVTRATVSGSVQCRMSGHRKDTWGTAICKITECCPLRGVSGAHLAKHTVQNWVKFEVRSSCSRWCPGKVRVPPWMSLRMCQSMTTLIVNFCFYRYLTGTFLAATWICCSLSCHVHLCEESGSLLCVSSKEVAEDSSKLPSSPALMLTRTFPTTPYFSCAAAPASPGPLHWTPSSATMSFSYYRALNWTQCSRCSLTWGRERKKHFPGPAGHALAKAVQHAVDLPCCQAYVFPRLSLSTSLLRAPYIQITYKDFKP